MVNFHALAVDDKTTLKPLVDELRKQLYTEENQELFEDGGLTINFGKRAEARFTVKIEIVA